MLSCACTSAGHSGASSPSLCLRERCCSSPVSQQGVLDRWVLLLGHMGFSASFARPCRVSPWEDLVLPAPCVPPNATRAVLQAATANAAANAAANATATSWWLQGFHGDTASAAARPRWVSMVRPARELHEDTGGMAGVAKLCAGREGFKVAQGTSVPGCCRSHTGRALVSPAATQGPGVGAIPLKDQNRKSFA